MTHSRKVGKRCLGKETSKEDSTGEPGASRHDQNSLRKWATFINRPCGCPSCIKGGGIRQTSLSICRNSPLLFRNHCLGWVWVQIRTQLNRELNAGGSYFCETLESANAHLRRIGEHLRAHTHMPTLSRAQALCCLRHMRRP